MPWFNSSTGQREVRIVHDGPSSTYVQVATMKTPNDASEVYDRQIRLWGADAQKKIGSAKVLYVNLSAASLEVMKNLVLAGVQAAIFDGRPYASFGAATPTPFIHQRTSEAVTSVETSTTDCEPKQKKQKLSNEVTGDASSKEVESIKEISVAKVMQPLVVELNPLLGECHIDERSLCDIPSEEFAKYDVVIASRVSKKESIRIANATVEAGNSFFLIDCFGLMGCAVLDLGKDHVFRKELGKDKLSDPMKNVSYVPFETIINLKLAETKKTRWEKIPPKIWAIYKSFLDFQAKHDKLPTESTKEAYESFCQEWILDQRKEKSDIGFDVPMNLLGDDPEAIQHLACLASAEVSPVCAILGGVIGNEVIKCISGKGEPANNVLLVDGLDSSCRSVVVIKK